MGGLSQLIGGLLVVVEILELGWLECKSCLPYITIEHLTSVSSSIKWGHLSLKRSKSQHM